MHGKLPYLLTGLLIGVLIFPGLARGDSIEDLNANLDKVQKEIEQKQDQKSSTQEELQKAKQEEEKYRGSLNYFQYQYATTQQKLNATLAEISSKEAAIAQAISDIETKQAELKRRRDLLNQTVRALYMETQTTDVGALTLLKDFSNLTKTLIYRDAVVGEYKTQIQDLKVKIQKLEEDKQTLEKLKNQLQDDKAALEVERSQLASSINQTRQNISEAQSEQQRLQQDLIGLENSLGELTQKEREILAAKAAAALASTTVGNEAITRAKIEKGAPQDGKTYFSFWTYGYPHRVGMNQYGAYGRAKAGQNVETILKAYYSGVEVTNYDTPEKIEIITSNNQHLTLNLESEYLTGIGEMPSCWGSPKNGGLEALKAQAIAARTYALNYTQNGEAAICTDQNCQVYVGKSKVEGKCGQHWQRAVRETKGKVITAGGEPISAWYHSTSGGFTLSSLEVWGGARGYAQGITDLDPKGLAYDGPSHGNSPWYHKAWGDKPWLSSEQVTKLFNAALEEDGQETRIDNLQTLAVTGADGPQTQKLIAYYGQPGNLQETSVDAKKFRYVFNLQSPGTDAIWTTRYDVRANQ